MGKHDRIYNGLLVALECLLLLSCASMTAMLQNPTIPAEGKTGFRISMYVNACFISFVAFTLAARFLFPPAARRAITMGLNIILLVLIPFGTAVGIYGLLKVDKD
jgi:hypothetical protein